MENRPIRILPLLVLLTACSSKPDEQQRSSQLAGELVTCQNERSGLREQIAQANRELAQAKTKQAEQAATIQQQQQQQQQRSGRMPARRLDAFAHEVPGARPKVHLEDSAPSSPEAEQHEAQAVAQLLRGNVGQLRGCYEKGLKRNSNLQFVTQVKVQLTVDQTGHARQVHVSPKSGQDLEDCMRLAIMGWQFPTYRGSPVVVEQPVSLKVKGS